MIKAKEWSVWVGNWCIGLFRNNLGGFELVYRYPCKTGGEMNVFVPLWGEQG